MNSFQARVNAKIAAAAIPGEAIGKETLKKDFILEQPSISAASSISLGTVSKYPFNSQVFRGIVHIA